MLWAKKKVSSVDTEKEEMQEVNTQIQIFPHRETVAVGHHNVVTRPFSIDTMV